MKGHPARSMRIVRKRYRDARLPADARRGGRGGGRGARGAGGPGGRGGGGRGGPRGGGRPGGGGGGGRGGRARWGRPGGGGAPPSQSRQTIVASSRRFPPVACRTESPSA